MVFTSFSSFPGYIQISGGIYYIFAKQVCAALLHGKDSGRPRFPHLFPGPFAAPRAFYGGPDLFCMAEEGEAGCFSPACSRENTIPPGPHMRVLQGRNPPGAARGP